MAVEPLDCLRMGRRWWRAGLAARPSLGEVLRFDAPRYRVLSTAYSQEVQCSAKTSLRRVLKATAVRAIPTPRPMSAPIGPPTKPPRRATPAPTPRPAITQTAL